MSRDPMALAEALRTRYEIIRELGRGGMATVYLAQDLRHDREVALKVLRPELTAVLGRDRFLGEIRLTARLDHPHLLTLLDSGDAGDALYYVLPYIQGGSLRQRLDRERHLPIEEAVRIGCQLAGALDYAHALGIVHRDIKPENILLHTSGPMLTDFGIALAVSQAGGERLTETGIIVGTPQYMSPEQATGDRHLDGRSDLYSLGAVMYEMLAGESPVPGTSAQAIIARLLTERPTPLRVVRPTIPEGIAAVVERSLAKIPADRFPNGGEFARALTAAPVRVTPFKRLLSKRNAGITAAALIGGAAAVWALSQVHTGPTPSSSLIAVLPSTTSTPDSVLTRLGRDLVYTLSANLAGAGEIRAVDPESVLSRSPGRGSPSRSEDLAFGRSLGAGQVVRGTLVKLGSQVRWDVALLSSTNGDLLAQASATAPAESLRALGDTATRSLLKQIWLRGQTPSPSLEAAVKTRSIPALKALLSGEGQLAVGHWNEAAQAYNNAILADSTFWLAYWRLWFVNAWSSVDVDQRIITAAREHRAELPDRERLLIEACSCVADSLPKVLRLGREVTTRFPDDWFAWLSYADGLVHLGPVLGYTAQDARTALERALTLQPGLVDGWEHLFIMSLGKDSVTADRSLHALDSLGKTEEVSRAVGFDVRMWNRLAARLQGTAGVAPHPLVDSLAVAIQHTDSSFGVGWGAFALLRFGFPAAQNELSELLLTAGLSPKTALAHQRSRAIAWAMRGGWDSSLAILHDLAITTSEERDPMAGYRFAVLAAWSGAVDPSVALAARPAAAHAIGAMPADERAEEERIRLTWLDGVLAAVRHDRHALTETRLTAERSHAGLASYVTRSLRALDFKLQGHPRELADSLIAADLGQQWDESAPVTRSLILSINRLTESEALLAVGDTAAAVKQLLWHEAELNPSTDNLYSQVLAALAYLQLGRVARAQGQTALAREDYEQFLRRYDRPMPSLQRLTQEATQALSELGAAPTHGRSEGNR